METNTNEPGTPVYSVTVQESRRVTMSKTFTVLGGTPETAKAEGKSKAAREWQRVAELGGFSLGAVEPDYVLDQDARNREPQRITFRDNGDANSYALLDDSGRWWLNLLHNGEETSARQVANLRRMAAVWNACNGIAVDVLEEVARTGGFPADRSFARGAR